MALTKKVREQLRDRKVIDLGKHSVATAKGQKERVQMYGNFSSVAQTALGVNPIRALKVVNGRTIILSGGDAQTVRVRLKTKGGASSGYKNGVVTIRVPSQMPVEGVADFLLKNARSKVHSFQINGRGRSYPLSIFESSGGGAT